MEIEIKLFNVRYAHYVIPSNQCLHKSANFCIHKNLFIRNIKTYLKRQRFTVLRICKTHIEQKYIYIFFFCRFHFFFFVIYFYLYLIVIVFRSYLFLLVEHDSIIWIKISRIHDDSCYGGSKTLGAFSNFYFYYFIIFCIRMSSPGWF